jgi:hypothetical protein
VEWSNMVIVVRASAASLAIVLVAGCVGDSPAPTPTGAPNSTPAATAHPSEIARSLRRPWQQPALKPGAPCPATTDVTRPDPALGPLFGDGPARPGLGPNAVLEYIAPDGRSDWSDRTWGGQKLLWAVDPAAAGPVLVRGRRLDGPGAVAFEDPVIAELLIEADDREGLGGGWRDYPSYTRLRVPGCYAFQVDSASGTWSIVFTAQGPRLE